MTDSQKVFIVENRLNMQASSIAKKIGMSSRTVSNYIREQEIKPSHETIRRWQSETMIKVRAKRSKDSDYETKMDKMIVFAKSLGYANSAVAIKALGVKEFKKQFEQNQK